MKKLRSQQWFYGKNETGLLHKGALRAAGINMDNYHGQPVIGIANTWSQLNNCNMSLRDVANDVKKGIVKAGAIAVEFPVISLGEELMKPSAMLYRNLLSIDIEENLRSYPIDGVVLLGNCDKTVPGLLMGAASANLPTIQLNAGPKQVGIHKGQRLGSGTDLWKYWDELRLGNIDDKEWEDIGKALSCGFGACNTMGTASTMNGIMEALGMMPLGSSTMAVYGQQRSAVSEYTGLRIVEMVNENLRPSDILTPAAFDNAIRLLLALGGSTNAIIHLTAMAGRMGISLFPDRFDKLGRDIPCITNVQPSGEMLIDQFHEAGGIPAVLHTIKDYLDLDAMTISGKTIGEELKQEIKIDNTIILPIANPLIAQPTLAVLHGNLAPDGAVIKVSAASPHLLKHQGKAVVFENYDDMLDNIDNPQLEVEPNSVLVLKNAGPKGVPGMPEWGMIPIPKKIKAMGINDMVRISDSRMSGTSFGTVILHVAPEAFVGGNIGLIENGDIISLDVTERTLNIMVSDSELENRRNKKTQASSKHLRGYPALYVREVLQANEGCDLAFLKPKNKEELHFIEPIVGRS